VAGFHLLIELSTSANSFALSPRLPSSYVAVADSSARISVSIKATARLERRRFYSAIRLLIASIDDSLCDEPRRRTTMAAWAIRRKSWHSWLSSSKGGIRHADEFTVRVYRETAVGLVYIARGRHQAGAAGRNVTLAIHDIWVIPRRPLAVCVNPKHQSEPKVANRTRPLLRPHCPRRSPP